VYTKVSSSTSTRSSSKVGKSYGKTTLKKLIVFDLDGTLAESKSSLDAEMSGLLHRLLEITKVAVISGGDWPQFEKQLLANLPDDKSLVNLSILPACGTKFFEYTNDWKKIYSEDFNDGEKQKIVESLRKALQETGFKVEKTWGEVIEDRGTQITFSAWGQQAPLEEKQNGTTISPNERRSKRSLTALFLSSPYEWAARHPLILRSMASTRPTESGSCKTSFAFQRTR
jgi:phosphomannomutase